MGAGVRVLVAGRHRSTIRPARVVRQIACRVTLVPSLHSHNQRQRGWEGWEDDNTVTALANWRSQRDAGLQLMPIRQGETTRAVPASAERCDARRKSATVPGRRQSAPRCGRRGRSRSSQRPSAKTLNGGGVVESDERGQRKRTESHTRRLTRAHKLTNK